LETETEDATFNRSEGGRSAGNWLSPRGKSKQSGNAFKWEGSKNRGERGKKKDLMKNSYNRRAQEKEGRTAILLLEFPSV